MSKVGQNNKLPRNAAQQIAEVRRSAVEEVAGDYSDELRDIVGAVGRESDERPKQSWWSSLKNQLLEGLAVFGATMYPNKESIEFLMSLHRDRTDEAAKLRRRSEQRTVRD